MGRRITRKQLKQDEFVSIADTAIQWFVENWRPIVAGLVAVCLAILLWWVSDRWSGSRADQASQMLQEAVNTYEGSTPEQADPAAAEQQFQEVVERYGRTQQADMARVYIARIRMGRGEIDEARNLLVQVTDRRRGDIIGRLATLDLVHLRIATGQGSEVAGELEAMAAGQDSSLPRDTALFELGELYSSEKKLDQARLYYRRLVEEFPESPYRFQAQQRLNELG
jgi:predicted negative regulator of RcsB-dependent stress response